MKWWRRSRTATETGSAEASELRQRLTREQYRVTQKSGTERPFSGEYWQTKLPGIYHCIVCDEPLFDSEAKYDSGTGWPSFTDEVATGKVARSRDWSMIVRRTEARCAKCDAHLGHIFPDGPGDTGDRYCMNSAALRLDTASS